jgi:sulfide:quinone oxidoreductase
MKNIVILGAGTAGTMMANKLRRRLPESGWRITVVDRDGAHIYQPGLLFLPFGTYREEDLVRSRQSLLDHGIDLVYGEIDRIAPDTKTVSLTSGERLVWDVLIVATGTRIVPEETEGLAGAGWQERMFDFYTLEGARNLRNFLASWEGGRMVVNVVDMPIKCPVAPLEFLFLADAFFTERGMRDKVEIVYATPLSGAFTKPRASAALGGLLESRNIRVETNFAVAAADGERGELSSHDGRTTNFDVLVSVPLHSGAEAISRSGLGDPLGFVPTDKHTLQTKADPSIFALGDCTDLPASKAGSVAHFQAEVLTENVLSYIAQTPMRESFDGHANCFIETGHGKAMLIDFNYETEPLPGRFPLPGVGPFTLLEESHVNHWGKLGFRWVYWNMLVRGEELPIDHRMVMNGKWS